MANGRGRGDEPVAGAGDAAQAKARVRGMFSEIAPTYGAGVELFDVFGRGLVAAAAIQPGEHVVDLACGRGACLLPAAEAVGTDGHVVGIDLSPTMVELTAATLQREKIVNAEVRVGDAEHLDVADASFDVLTCGFGVFFFPQPAATVEARRVVRPGGRFAASTFNNDALDYPWLPEIIDEMGLLGSLRGVSGQTAPMLKADGLWAILAAVGFERVATTTVEHRFVFPDVDAYMLWVRSHAYGIALRGLSESHQQRFQDQCTDRLQQHQAADGYEFIKRVDFTVAHRR